MEQAKIKGIRTRLLKPGTMKTIHVKCPDCGKESTETANQWGRTKGQTTCWNCGAEFEWEEVDG